jgi:PAS domain S-box-containing protein
MSLIWITDIIGSSIIMVLSIYAIKLMRAIYVKKRDIPLYSYLYAQTIAIAIFAFSRSVGHIVKRILITVDQPDIWQTLSPISGSVNTITFVVFSLIALLYSNVKATSERVDALEKKERELRESEEKYRTLVEGASDAIVATDPVGNITSWNRGAQKMLGYKPEEAIGKPAATIVPEDLRDEQKEMTMKVKETGLVEGYETIRVAKDGTRIPVEMAVSAMKDEGGRVIGLSAIIRDITERKRTEEQILRQSAVLDAINKVFRETLRCETDEEVARISLAVAEGLTGSKFGFIGEVNESGRLDLIALSDPGWEACRMPKSDAVRMVKDMEIRGIWGRVLKDERPLIVNDPASHPDRVGIPEGHPPLTSFLGVPLKRGGKTTGMIALANKEGGYNLADQEDIETLSVAFLEALIRKRAEEALKKHREHLEETVKERTAGLEEAQKALVTLLEDMNEAKEELQEANIQLKELDQLKSMFIASMSHELRTPLNSIIGFTGIILQGMTGEITGEQRKQLTMVKNSASHLLDLINDIIDLSKIEADKVELTIEEFNLPDIVQEVKDFLTVAAEEKGLEMSVKMPERLVVESDERRTRQVLVNLVSNAVKFTDEGEIRIKVAKKDGTAEISVRDTGIGIKNEDMGKLFRAFSQIPIEGRPTQEGTGLGLYLSKKITDLLGGNIWAESKHGKGSVFTFALALKYREVKA